MIKKAVVLLACNIEGRSNEKVIFNLINRDFYAAVLAHNETFSFLNMSSNTQFVDLQKVSIVDNGLINGVLFELYCVSAKLHESNKISNSNLEYVILKMDGRYYRIFGFFTTDVRLLMDKFSNNDLKELLLILHQNKILNKSEFRSYWNSIKKIENNFLDSKVRKPSQFLELYYPNNFKLNRSIIINSRPLSVKEW